MFASGIVCFFASVLSIAFGAKILLLPTPVPSRTSQMKVMGEALVKSGHEVHMVLPPAAPALKKMTEEGRLILHGYAMAEDDMFTMKKDSSKAKATLEFYMKEHPHTVFGQTGDPKIGFVQWCTNMLRDDALFEKLDSLKFDLAILDSHPLTLCFYIVPYRLHVPYISTTGYPEFWFTRTPAFPSVVPYVFGKPANTQEMNFLQRLDNLWTQLVWTLTPGMPQRSDYQVVKYAPEMPAVSLIELAGRSLIWFIDSSHIAIDYPRPVMPNEKFIGGLTTKPANPLPEDLQEYVTNAEHGIIVVSFGAFAGDIPDGLLTNMIKAFGQVQQKVIWRLLNKGIDLPDNVLAVNWLPQADLLGNNKTKLFITHCGANGQFEALYHAVPMLGIPLFAEQRYNAKRMAYKGMGEYLDPFELTADTLYQTIQKVVDNPEYKANIGRASSIYKTEPMSPAETVVYWTEHVLRYGGEHLHSYALDMPWYEFLMLDILAFVSTILFLVTFVLSYSLYFIYNYIKGNVGKKQKQN